jgi:16S rRNA (adenine1518-N6/adenine1519-N6)-dimethyltransferase
MDKEKYFAGIAQYKLLAKREVGQNFLVDAAIAQKIVAAAEISPNDFVLEIGSGAGSLSYFISEYPCQADLIDIDEGLVAKLANDFQKYPNMRPQVGNVMKWDLSSYTKIIGNLPYYITSSILEKTILGAASCEKAVFMIQKEAFQRIFGKNGEFLSGPLPLLIKYRTAAKKIFNVPRTAFSPMPHVDSIVFALNFDKSVTNEETAKLYDLLKIAFAHRRKTIANNLAGMIPNGSSASEFLGKIGIEAHKRPSDLSLADYLSILSALN